MPDVSPERIAVIARAARIPLQPASAERIAASVSMPVNRLAAADLAIPFEAEPSTFLVIQQREIDR
jgi:hypothetical protein